MTDSDPNIADIAFATGYENASHFCRAFKRLTGMTPRDYRRGPGLKHRRRACCPRQDLAALS
jgi:AraC-like DNA-binding protein